MKQQFDKLLVDIRLTKALLTRHFGLLSFCILVYLVSLVLTICWTLYFSKTANLDEKLREAAQLINMPDYRTGHIQKPPHDTEKEKEKEIFSLESIASVLHLLYSAESLCKIIKESPRKAYLLTCHQHNKCVCLMSGCQDNAAYRLAFQFSGS